MKEGAFKQRVLPKNKIWDFVDKLIKKHDVIAPTKDEVSKFEKISSAKQMYLEKLTEVPAKKIFFPDGEVLVEFKKGKATEVVSPYKKTIVFGMRKCDLNAVQILDTIMFDKQYQNKRKNTVLIGLFCDKPDDFCFCNSMGLEEYYDLFFYPTKDNYQIFVGSKNGEKLIKDLPLAKKQIKLPNPKNKNILKKTNVKGNYRNKAWEKDANKCLSCSACTEYCPTCNCFDIKDELDINLKDGVRKRYSSSCQLKSFSRVAGGKNYRDSRLSRFKHFVYHKIVYFKDRQGRFMCVGCGRCLRVCPTKIDWTKTINKFKKANKK